MNIYVSLGKGVRIIMRQRKYSLHIIKEQSLLIIHTESGSNSLMTVKTRHKERFFDANKAVSLIAVDLTIIVYRHAFMFSLSSTSFLLFPEDGNCSGQLTYFWLAFRLFSIALWRMSDTRPILVLSRCRQTSQHSKRGTYVQIECSQPSRPPAGRGSDSEMELRGVSCSVEETAAAPATDVSYRTYADVQHGQACLLFNSSSFKATCER